MSHDGDGINVLGDMKVIIHCSKMYCRYGFVSPVLYPVEQGWRL